jgi:transketolase
LRKVFFDQLSSAAKKDNQIILLSADLGFGFIEDFVRDNPYQFINVGVSEQAMLGLANGLAIGGRKVICYSIASFSLIRPFEFFRNGAIAQKSSVLVVGVGPGFDYAHDGLTHYCLEDLALMQSQPGVMIKTPFSTDGLIRCLNDFVENPQPTYLRLPRNIENFEIIDLENHSSNYSDVLIIFTALMSKRAFDIKKSLQNRGITVIAGSLNQIDHQSDKKIIEHLKYARKCLVIEDHYEFGGLGTRVGDLILANNLQTKLVKDGVTIIPTGEVGDFNFMVNKLMKNIENVITLLI